MRKDGFIPRRKCWKESLLMPVSMMNARPMVNRCKVAWVKEMEDPAPNGWYEGSGTKCLHWDVGGSHALTCHSPGVYHPRSCTINPVG